MLAAEVTAEVTAEVAVREIIKVIDEWIGRESPHNTGTSEDVSGAFNEREYLPTDDNNGIFASGRGAGAEVRDNTSRTCREIYKRTRKSC